jgi:cytochrome c biogenesis protein CcmG, thiol:disulfide interchange protein DsbE
MPSAILRDPTQRIKKTFQTTGVPETFVIGPEGMIRKKVIGADDWNSEGNRALIAQLIREKAQARRPAPDSSLQRP